MLGMPAAGRDCLDRALTVIRHQPLQTSALLACSSSVVGHGFAASHQVLEGSAAEAVACKSAAVCVTHQPACRDTSVSLRTY